VSGRVHLTILTELDCCERTGGAGL